MKDKDFAAEIEKARTRLQADYRDVTVSATMWRDSATFVTVKTPQWEQHMEWRRGDAPDMPLSEWIYNEIRAIHAPDVTVRED